MSPKRQTVPEFIKIILLILGLTCVRRMRGITGVIINVSVRVISLAFGSANNSYLDIDNSAYHKNLIQ